MPGPVRVLLVDDDTLIRETLAEVFREAGFHVLQAGSGREALALLAAEPGLIVLDIHLPDVSGFELCRRIRGMPGTGSIAILHLSALHTGSEDRSRGLDGGAEAFLVKPVDPRELLATARALLRIHAAQGAVERAAQQWRTTFDAISDAICLLDPTGTLLRCNRAMAGLLGHSFADLLGRPFTGALQEALQLAEVPPFLQHGPARREVREVCLGERWFLATWDPIVDGDGRSSACVLILSDITQRRQLEEQLRQKQKMEAVGRLAGGVAHDFNNLLTAILGNASLIKQQLGCGQEQELLRTVEQAAWRAAELTRQLLGFSQQTLLWLEPCNLNDPIREVVALLSRSQDPRIILETRLHPGLGLVRADSRQMGQVLTNLCLNARDAMPDGGRLVIETAPCLVDAAQAGRHPDARIGPAARLSVIDTGMGIPAELLPRIFDPFFTTKPVGKGTGLGLAMVFGIVKQHHGWIECHSEVGRGTRFDVYLPLIPAAPAAAQPAPGPAQAEADGVTILVADDNEMLRKLAATLLRHHGYQVLLAADGQEAVEMFQKEPEAIALVLLDLMMPRLSGLEALHEMRKIDPDIRIVLASGFADLERSEVERARVQGFIAKPYRERDLISAVRSALGAPGAVDNGLCAVP